jgi:hypothetical protein
VKALRVGPLSPAGGTDKAGGEQLGQNENDDKSDEKRFEPVHEGPPVNGTMEDRQWTMESVIVYRPISQDGGITQIFCCCFESTAKKVLLPLRHRD